MTSAKKTFLFVTDTDYESGILTGGHRRFLELVKGISEKNEVILVSKKIPGIKSDSIKTIEVSNKKISFLPSHINKILAISKILHKEKKNITYDYAVSFGPVDAVCYKINGYRNVITLFRDDYIGYRKVVRTSVLKLLYFKKLEKIAVKYSKKIIVQCNDDKKALIERYGKKIRDLVPKIFVQINNVNASWIVNDAVSLRRRKNDGVVRMVFIGNFVDSRKGHQLLLPAIDRLEKDGYNLELLVIGDGIQLEDYKKRFKGSKSIVFLGRRRDVGGLLSESDIEIVPSLMDSCPNTVLEGINAGIAVYGTNVGGIKEMLQKHEYLFEPSVDSIYWFIKKKIDDRQYIKDARDQRKIKERLTFDWSEKILSIITHQEAVDDER